MKVRELMTTDVVSVGPDEPVKEAARIMVETSVSGLPVIDDGGNLVGIVTEADFVAGEAGRRADHRAGLLRFILNRQTIGSEELLVSDLMTPNVLTVGPDSDHTEAARLMDRESVKRLLVVDNGKVVGIISRADMLRAFTRSDSDIVTEISDHLIRDVLWIDPARVRVESVDGNVVLDGRVESKTDANLIVELARRVDGVASVNDQLSWEFDNTKGEFTPPPGVPRPPR